MNRILVERVAGYIKHREPHLSRSDAYAAAMHAIDELAAWMAPQRMDTPANGWEFANTMLGSERYGQNEEQRSCDERSQQANHLPDTNNPPIEDPASDAVEFEKIVP